MQNTMRMIVNGRTVAALALFVSAQWAFAAGPAKEGSFHGMTCFTGPAHVIAEVKDHVGVSYEIVGTLIRKEGELGYLSSERCEGESTIIGKESSTRGSCVSTDPDGDHVFFVYTSTRTGLAGTWKAVAGSGKYEGIEAHGTWANAIRPVKPAQPGTTQVCNKETGHWKLM
jgi:hypothetical protein